MPHKNIYQIDNYFIAIGWFLLVTGLLTVALDPFRWNDLVVKERSGNTTNYTFANKAGRTLEVARRDITRDKGERFTVENSNPGFPLVRLIFLLNGLILLGIGYTYRAREKKIIALWNALDHAGEAHVEGLTVALGQSREFILASLKHINAQRHAAYTFDSRSDKIINSRLQSTFLVQADCAKCGHKISQLVQLDLSNPPRCQYCGTGVTADHLNQFKRDVLASLHSAPAAQATASTAAPGNEINVVLLVVLLMLFWPAAVVYVIRKKAKA